MSLARIGPMERHQNFFEQQQQQPASPTSEKSFFEVPLDLKNDTLNSLAMRYSCSVHDLKQLNGLQSERDLFGLKTCKIPTKNYQRSNTTTISTNSIGMRRNNSSFSGKDYFGLINFGGGQTATTTATSSRNPMFDYSRHVDEDEEHLLGGSSSSPPPATSSKSFLPPTTKAVSQPQSQSNVDQTKEARDFLKSFDLNLEKLKKQNEQNLNKLSATTTTTTRTKSNNPFF